MKGILRIDVLYYVIYYDGMKTLKSARGEQKISQRNLAKKAGLSYKTLQLLEGGNQDAQISTLEKVASALGLPKNIITRRLSAIFQTPSDSLSMVSERIHAQGEALWKIWLFNFVDAFRRVSKPEELIQDPPISKSTHKTKALLASTLDTLCEERGIKIPEWSCSIPPLQKPWFVSQSENLKATALVESPLHFRKRNIFVLDNFLSRA